MKSIKFLAILNISLLLLIGGCATKVVETISPTTMTVEQLEENMNKASDPYGNFKNSKSFMLREVAIFERRYRSDQELVFELKFEQPDKFKLLSLQDNKPLLSIIYDGRFGYIVNYKDKKIDRLEDVNLQQLKVMVMLLAPSSKYSTVFQDLKIYSSTLDGEKYYLLECYWHDKKQQPMKLYVDCDDFLVKRAETNLLFDNKKISEVSKILNYSMEDGVMVPAKSESVENGIRQTGELIYFKLNPKLSVDEFKPPIF